MFREHPMRVILVTGYHAPEHIHDALGKMVLAYLAKPFARNELVAAIAVADEMATALPRRRQSQGKEGGSPSTSLWCLQRAFCKRQRLRDTCGLVVKPLGALFA